MASTPTPTPQEVLAAAVQMHDHETTAAIAKLQLAVEWVRLHPGEAVDTSVPWGMRDLEIAGDGAPTVDEGAVDEFALAVGLSTDTGRRYLGDAVELCHRLPRIWARVLAGEVAVWKPQLTPTPPTNDPMPAGSHPCPDPSRGRHDSSMSLSAPQAPRREQAGPEFTQPSHRVDRGESVDA